MNTILTILTFVLLGALVVLVCKKLCESIVNLIVVFKKGTSLDLAKQRNGVVLNEETKKLEADQAVILPF